MIVVGLPADVVMVVSGEYWESVGLVEEESK